MSSTHTPGPWTLDSVDEDSGLIGWWIHGPTGHVCHVYDRRLTRRAQADARLIAAAPELLAAAEHLLDRLDADHLGAWDRNERDALAAAVAKARGES